jgi:lysylphosphatidylglycerol synthetase-like protein (DUF2156 family)
MMAMVTNGLPNDQAAMQRISALVAAEVSRPYGLTGLAAFAAAYQRYLQECGRWCAELRAWWCVVQRGTLLALTVGKPSLAQQLVGRR